VSRTFHRVEVLRRQQLSPGMIRLTLGGAGFYGFRSTGIADEYLRLFFPDPETGVLSLPVIDAEGRWTYPDGQAKVRYSTYTVRRFDEAAKELDLDFVVHEGGMASEWAQRANLGDLVTINSPRGLYKLPEGAAWQVLIADATGLPALSRLLEEGPSIPTRAFIEVHDASHELPLQTNGLTSVTWLHGGNGYSGSQLEEVARRVPVPPGLGYFWVAGEQKVVRRIRKFVRQELQLPASQYEVVGYWVEKQQEWEARWEALDPAIRNKIDAAWASDRDREDVQDEVDASFDLLGL
jgi:NADPH-dependent ferric siderophore reductase